MLLFIYLSQEGVSALQLAAEGNHTACMELLLMAGAKVDLKNRVRAPVVSVRSRIQSANI